MELQKAAASVGIRILMEGEIPASEKIQKVFLVSAMECLLNAYQYADATELHIAVIRNKQRRCVLIRYSNNGKQPAGHIQAGGGLTLVRQAAEEAKGTVRWSDHPDFSLEIELPLP